MGCLLRSPCREVHFVIIRCCKECEAASGFLLVSFLQMQKIIFADAKNTQKSGCIAG